MPPEEPPKKVRTTKPPNAIRRQKPPSDRLLALVAELRAAGATWPAAAARAGKSESAVSRWPRKYPDRWLAALLRAERRQALDSGAESVLVLRTLLRSDDPKVRRDAAKLLIALRVDLARLDVTAKFAPEAPARPPEVAEAVAFLEDLTRDEIADLAREFLAPAAAAGPGPAGRAGGGGPG